MQPNLQLQQLELTCGSSSVVSGKKLEYSADVSALLLVSGTSYTSPPSSLSVVGGMGGGFEIGGGGLCWPTGKGGGRDSFGVGGPLSLAILTLFIRPSKRCMNKFRFFLFEEDSFSFARSFAKYE